MELELISDPSCELCGLHAGARNVCVPTLHYNILPSVPRALVFIAQNPGHKEDELNEPLIGRSGQYVRKVLCGSSLDDSSPSLNNLLNIYFANTARCATPPETPPRDSHYKTCSSNYLYPELDRIRAAHSETMLICLGRPASAYVWKYLTGSKGPGAVSAYTSLNGSSFPQHTHFIATYHPAAMLRDRTYHESIINHMRVALDILMDRRPAVTTPHIIPPTSPSDWSP